MSNEGENQVITKEDVGELSLFGNVRYTCKGPRLLPGGDDLVKLWAKENEGEPTEESLEAFRQKLVLADLRLHCGADLTTLIEAVPADGQDHLVKCPKCGTVTRTMRTPSETTSP